MVRIFIRRIVKIILYLIPYPYFKELFSKIPYSRFNFVLNFFNGMEEVEYYGVKLNVNPGDNLGFYLYFLNNYEENLIKKLIEICSGESIFFDIGSNFGWISLAVANNCENLEVYAFEPDKIIGEELLRNLNNNKHLSSRINLIDMAVSNENTDLFYTPSYAKNNPGIGRINKENQNEKSYLVNSIKLDTFCRNKKIFPDVVKIDVEGEELNVLKGMRKLFKFGYPKVIFLETHGFYYGDKISEFNNSIVSELKKSNYQIFKFIDDSLISLDLSFEREQRAHLFAFKTN